MSYIVVFYFFLKHEVGHILSVISRSEQLSGAHANEIKQDHSPVLIVI